METKICDIVKKNPALVALKNEDVLELELTIVGVPTAINEIGECHKYLKIDNDEIPNLTIDSIKYMAFNKLFDEATALGASSSRSYVTGLKVNLGIKNGEIFLVFQPVYLSKSTNVDEPNRYYVHEGLYYVYEDDTTGFVPAAAEDLASLVSYNDHIRIKHSGEGDFKEYREQIDSKAVIIPFQVIFSLIYDSESNTDVFLFNAVVERMVRGVNQVNHTVLMGTARDEETITYPLKARVRNYTGMYADRSHLCPPCNYVDTLNIARSGPTNC